MNFEVLMQEVAVEEHCRGRKGGMRNKQNRLHVLKMYVACCCFTSFEWELGTAQELSGFIFGQHITQFKDDKAQAVHYLFEKKWKILECYLLTSLSSVKLCY